MMSGAVESAPAVGPQHGGRTAAEDLGGARWRWWIGARRRAGGRTERGCRAGRGRCGQGCGGFEAVASGAGVPGGSRTMRTRMRGFEVMGAGAGVPGRAVRGGAWTWGVVRTIGQGCLAVWGCDGKGRGSSEPLARPAWRTWGRAEGQDAAFRPGACDAAESWACVRSRGLGAGRVRGGGGGGGGRRGWRRFSRGR